MIEGTWEEFKEMSKNWDDYSEEDEAADKLLFAQRDFNDHAKSNNISAALKLIKTHPKQRVWEWKHKPAYGLAALQGHFNFVCFLAIAGTCFASFDKWKRFLWLSYQTEDLFDTIKTQTQWFLAANMRDGKGQPVLNEYQLVQLIQHGILRAPSKGVDELYWYVFDGDIQTLAVPGPHESVVQLAKDVLLPWVPLRHYLFHAEYRHLVRTVYFVAKRQSLQADAIAGKTLPIELWELILGFLPRDSIK